jgi:hypothetical protein
MGGPDRNLSCGRYGKLWTAKPGFTTTEPEIL